MLVTVNLVGQLGKLFGKQWTLDIRNTAEAIRAIAAQCEGFAEYLESSATRGLVYRVTVDEDDIEEDKIYHPIRQSLSIAPIVAGAGAVGRIILGVALVGLSFVLPGIGLGFASTVVGGFGVSMIAGGIVELLSPQQDQENKNSDSYLFDGAQLTRAYQGQPVPVLFGTRLIQPLPISIWVDNENIAVDFVP
jgi:predicted phage tail protein